LGSRSSCADERFLGRCGGLVPWSWIIVRVFKAKSGGYPKVNGPTEFFPGDAPLQKHIALSGEAHFRDAGRGRERQGIDQNTGGNCDPALRDSSAASLASDCGSSWPQSCGGEHTRDYFLSVFGRGRCRNRTPGPPPLSSMNSTPAASRARRTAKSLAVVIDVWASVSSARRIVVTPRVDSRARSSALQRRRARAALICALVRGFSFILTCLIPHGIIHTVQSGYDRIDFANKRHSLIWRKI